MSGPFDNDEVLVATVRELCMDVRGAVRPLLGSPAAKEVEGRGASGDATFSIDEVAERKVEAFLAEIPSAAFYSEDRGLVASPGATHLFIVDPIDGTRPAAAGLESCCVSVAVAPLEGRDAGSLVMRDVTLGMVCEIKERALFWAVRGGGARIELDGRQAGPCLSKTADPGRMFWTAGYRGRPAEALTTVISELIDLSSVDGGYFDLGSATYSITRVITGQMDTYVDVGQRIVEEVSAVLDEFLAVGHGSVLNNYPYDLAAAALIASECGAVVSDASGGSLDGYPLVPVGAGGQLSSLVSSNEALHRAVLASLDEGISRLSARYRAQER